jgi:multisubunit Na+/H+ antiporter MnhB subunit
MTDWLSQPRVQSATRWLWGLLLFTLPVTTFRYIPGPLGRTTIKPLALYPLLFLAIILLIIFVRNRRIRLPGNILPLLAFLLVAIAFTVIGAVYSPLPLREAAFEERVLRGWLSLLIGLLFFFVAFWMNRTEKDLTWTLKWIYATLGITILWGLIQSLAVNTQLIPRSVLNDLQVFIASRPLQQRRISGFAYEPSWLADQLVIFFLPWLVAAVLKRRPLTKHRWLEPILGVGSVALLLFSYSRSGLLTAVACLVATVLLTGRQILAVVVSWFRRPFSQRGNGVAIAGRITVVLALVAFVAGSISFLARYEYFANLWQIAQADDPLDYATEAGAGPRLAYAIAGYRVFEGAPLTGVGLGASSLLLFDNFPDWSSNLPEIARQLSPDSTLIPNIKNLYIRLLAETGLPGFWLFVAFLFSFLAMIRRMHTSRNKSLQFVAAAGIFAWLAILLRNLSQDSLTFPVMWVILGIVAGLSPYSPKGFNFGRNK